MHGPTQQTEVLKSIQAHLQSRRIAATTVRPSSLKPRGLSSSARTMCIVHFSCHPLEIVVLRQPRHSVSRISALAVCGAKRRSGTNHMTATAAYTTYDPTGMTNAKPTPAA